MEVSELYDCVHFLAVLPEKPMGMLTTLFGRPAILNPCGLGELADMQGILAKTFCLR